MDYVAVHTNISFMWVLYFLVYLAKLYNRRMNSKTRQSQLYNYSFIYFTYHNGVFHSPKKVISNAPVRSSETVQWRMEKETVVVVLQK